jgi:hypothetical protein
LVHFWAFGRFFILFLTPQKRTSSRVQLVCRLFTKFEKVGENTQMAEENFVKSGKTTENIQLRDWNCSAFSRSLQKFIALFSVSLSVTHSMQ